MVGVDTGLTGEEKLNAPLPGGHEFHVWKLGRPAPKCDSPETILEMCGRACKAKAVAVLVRRGDSVWAGLAAPWHLSVADVCPEMMPTLGDLFGAWDQHSWTVAFNCEEEQVWFPPVTQGG